MTRADIEKALTKVQGSSCCTVSACELQDMLGGDVMGFFNHNNPTAKICPLEDGHDFLVLEEFIVDWWASKFRDLPAILDRKKDVVQIAWLYGDPERWERFCGNVRKYLVCHWEEVDASNSMCEQDD
jgi:hypothetical protein